MGALRAGGRDRSSSWRAPQPPRTPFAVADSWLAHGGLGLIARDLRDVQLGELGLRNGGLGAGGHRGGQRLRRGTSGEVGGHNSVTEPGAGAVACDFAFCESCVRGGGVRPERAAHLSLEQKPQIHVDSTLLLVLLRLEGAALQQQRDDGRRRVPPAAPSTKRTPFIESSVSSCSSLRTRASMRRTMSGGSQRRSGGRRQRPRITHRPL